MNLDYLQVSDGTGDSALMHVNAVRSIGSTTINVDTVVGVPAKFIATYGQVLPSGFINPATKRDFRGHLSGTSLQIDGWEPGSTDNGNASGDVVIIKPNTGWANRIATYIASLSGIGTAVSIVVNALSVAGNATIAGSLTVTGAFRSTPRNSAVASVATLAPNIDNYSIYDVTALAANLTISNPAGTPHNGDVILFRIKDNGTSRTISYGTAFNNISGLDLIVATTVSKWHVIGCTYNAATTSWQIVSMTTEA